MLAVILLCLPLLGLAQTLYFNGKATKSNANWTYTQGTGLLVKFVPAGSNDSAASLWFVLQLQNKEGNPHAAYASCEGNFQANVEDNLGWAWTSVADTTRMSTGEFGLWVLRAKAGVSLKQALDDAAYLKANTLATYQNLLKIYTSGANTVAIQTPNSSVTVDGDNLQASLSSRMRNNTVATLAFVMCTSQISNRQPTFSPITQIPTFSPTTGAPTTAAPTTQPTTAAPTTAAPTKTPTEQPTTAAPTKAPTKTPTEQPTKAPTKSPTESPTKAPTNSPTASPTNSPTASPTNSPTKSPTVKPSLERRRLLSPLLPANCTIQAMQPIVLNISSNVSIPKKNLSYSDTSDSFTYLLVTVPTCSADLEVYASFIQIAYDKSGLSGGAIAGIVIGAVVFCCAAVLIFLKCKKKKQSGYQEM